MEDRSIEINGVTKEAHGKFISWLNALLNNYVSSFYDDAVKNIIMLSFIREHYCFMVEMYRAQGTSEYGFITVLPTDSTNSILMLHNKSTGEPYLYNSTDIGNVLQFDNNGKPKRFFENVVIPLYDEGGVNKAELLITYKDYYGIKSPYVMVRYIGDNKTICVGLLDMVFEGKYSGTYMIKNKPLEDGPKYVVKNISLMAITLDIPVLQNLTIQYKINAGKTEIVPVTEFTEGYMRGAKQLGNIEVKQIQ